METTHTRPLRPPTLPLPLLSKDLLRPVPRRLSFGIAISIRRKVLSRRSSSAGDSAAPVQPALAAESESTASSKPSRHSSSVSLVPSPSSSVVGRVESFLLLLLLRQATRPRPQLTARRTASTDDRFAGLSDSRLLRRHALVLGSGRRGRDEDFARGRSDGKDVGIGRTSGGREVDVEVVVGADGSGDGRD